MNNSSQTSNNRRVAENKMELDIQIFINIVASTIWLGLYIFILFIDWGFDIDICSELKAYSMIVLVYNGSILIISLL